MDGDEIRARRQALKMTQEEMAQRLEVTRQSVYAWERGMTKAPGMLALALSWLEHEAEKQKEKA